MPNRPTHEILGISRQGVPNYNDKFVKLNNKWICKLHLMYGKCFQIYLNCVINFNMPPAHVWQRPPRIEFSPKRWMCCPSSQEVTAVPGNPRKPEILLKNQNINKYNIENKSFLKWQSKMSLKKVLNSSRHWSEFEAHLRICKIRLVMVWGQMRDILSPGSKKREMDLGSGRNKMSQAWKFEILKFSYLVLPLAGSWNLSYVGIHYRLFSLLF